METFMEAVHCGLKGHRFYEWEDMKDEADILPRGSCYIRTVGIRHVYVLVGNWAS